MRTGDTVFFDKPVYIAAGASVVGRREGEGPLRNWFDKVIPDALWGEESFEKCERKLFTSAVRMAAANAGRFAEKADLLLGGDLLNQVVSAGYSARDLRIPFLGLYGACSTMAESLIVGSMAVDGGFAETVLCAVSSHFGAAERQFRFPLELGTPKTPNSQNTVTGGAATCLSGEHTETVFARVTAATIGRVVDVGVTDADNMGAAMAPAAAQTVLTHFEDTGRAPSDYDAIITGDLGKLGAEILKDLCEEAGTDISAVHRDCGCMIFCGMKDEYCGGSGCACGGVTLNGYFFKQMRKKKLSRILFTATGALLSPTLIQQKDSIPSIAHAVVIERI